MNSSRTQGSEKPSIFAHYEELRAKRLSLTAIVLTLLVASLVLRVANPDADAILKNLYADTMLMVLLLLRAILTFGSLIWSSFSGWRANSFASEELWIAKDQENLRDIHRFMAAFGDAG